MAKINFTKMEGAGNDYIYIDLFKESISDPEKLSIAMSDRHFGIGADGLILIGPSDYADLQMIMFNADGSKAEMCGNGIRCVGKYAWDHGLVDSQSVAVETGAGIKHLEVSLDVSNRVDRATVQMGVPELDAAKIPSKLVGNPIVDQLFDFGDFSVRGTLVSMGNPHLITFVDDIDTVPVEKWGPIIEYHPVFPNRINIEFVQVISRSEIKQRTWERGSGETLACGTGASAVCVACVLNDKTESRILNHLTGGDLILTWEGPGNQVIMEGPAREVFTGVWEGA